MYHWNVSNDKRQQTAALSDIDKFMQYHQVIFELYSVKIPSWYMKNYKFCYVTSSATCKLI